MPPCAPRQAQVLTAAGVDLVAAASARGSWCVRACVCVRVRACACVYCFGGTTGASVCLGNHQASAFVGPPPNGMAPGPISPRLGTFGVDTPQKCCNGVALLPRAEHYPRLPHRERSIALAYHMAY